MGALGIRAQLKKGISRSLLLLCSLLFSFSMFSMSKEEQSTISSIENKIQIGQFKQAQAQLQQIVHSNSGSLEARYRYHKLLGKIYLNQQIMDQYLKCNNRALYFAQKLHPIYVSEVYANKAYFYHYLMWEDSALLYSNKSLQLLRKNWSFREKIEVPFVYEVFAICYLYRSVIQPPKAYLDIPIPDYKRLQFQWFDSALYYQSKYPFTFSTDLSMLYRSYANRWLDVVSEERKNKKTTLMQQAFKRSNQLYDKGISCLNPWHRNDYLVLLGLKGAIHTYMKKYKEADEIFNRALRRFSQKELMDRSIIAYQPLIVLQTFRVRNFLHLPYNSKKTDELIAELKQMRGDFWRSYHAENEYPYDPYRTSPYMNLFNLLVLKSINEPTNKIYFDMAVSELLTLKSYFYYLKNWRDRTFKSLPSYSIKKIQNRLKKDECYLLVQAENEFFNGKKILITQSTVKFVNSSTTGLLNERMYDTLSFKSFERKSYLDFQQNFESVLRTFPNVKKVYINYDDKNAYELMVQDTLGTSYTNANYVGKSINFVRVYDAVRYFSTEKSLNLSQIDVRFLKQRGQSALNFMQDFFKKFKVSSKFSNTAYQGNMKRLLNQPGILHIYGHGELTMGENIHTFNFQIKYLLSNSMRFENRLTGDFEVRRDLVVLNNCFSGYPMFLVNEFNRTIPLRIMSNGASSILVSPSKADDYFSSEFFRVFYQKIMEGEIFEDAVFQARNAFFNANPSMRHPKYWDAFQLVVSKKIRYVPNQPEQVPIQWWMILLLVDFSATLLGAWWRRNAPVRPLNETES
jgi:hypothetical protein